MSPHGTVRDMLRARVHANDMNDRAFVKENPAFHLAQDARRCLAAARQAQQDQDAAAESSWARISALLFAVSLEAFINYVYMYSGVPEREWRVMSFRDKWLHASAKCLPLHGQIEVSGSLVYRPGDPVASFDEGAEPFASFLELKSLRDRLVHLKPPFAEGPLPEVEQHLGRIEALPRTGLPSRVELFSAQHAESAERIYDAMTRTLDQQMCGQILPLFDGTGRIEIVADEQLMAALEEREGKGSEVL